MVKKCGHNIIISLSLISCFFSCQNNFTPKPPIKIPTNTIPFPNDGTIVFDGQEEGQNQNAREEWEKQLHQEDANPDWRNLDKISREERYLELLFQQNISPGSGSAESFASGALEGKWSERGSNNIAGNLSEIDYYQPTNTIYGISGGGTVWEGSMEGDDWTPLNDNLRFYNNLIKVIGNGNGGHRILAAQGKEMYYSDDNGANWSPSSGFNFDSSWGNPMDMIRLNDANESLYYLARTWSYDPWGASVWLYHSSDRGQSFERIGVYNQWDYKRIDLWSPLNSSDAYLLVNGSNLYSIGGNKLTLINSNNNLPTDKDIKLTGAKIGNTTTFYALVDYQDVYKSADNGATWTMTGSTTVKTWEEGMVAAHNDPTKLYMGAVNCLRSYDSGTNWAVVNTWGAYYGNIDLLHADIMDIRSFEKTDGVPFILVANHGGLHISYDDLQTTTNLSKEGLFIGQFYDVRTDPLNLSYIYAGSQDQGHQRTDLATKRGIIDFIQVVSGDYGSTAFSNNGKSLWTLYPFGAVHHYADAQKGGISEGRNIKGAHTNGWIYPTADVAAPSENSMWIGGGNIDGEEAAGSHLIKLTYNAVEDSIYANQIPFDFRSNTETDSAIISEIYASTVDGNRLYVGTSEGYFFYSNDNGNNWARTANFGGNDYNITSILGSKLTSDLLWIGGTGYSNPAIYKSVDGGQTFTEMATGLPNTLVREIAANADESLLFAATDVGPYVYVAANNQWYSMLGISTPQQTYRSVEYLAGIETIRFGTYGRGIWDFTLSCATNIYFADTDGDGLGDPNSSILGCSVPIGYADNANDCDDRSADVAPGKTEICDGFDNNCDGQIDEGFSLACGTYCTPSHWGNVNEHITKVSIGAIDNSSSSYTSATNGFSDFTNLSTTVIMGTDYPITINPNFSFTSSNLSIWVDWNKNLEFEDAELIETQRSKGPWNSTITPPTDAFIGPVKMRIRLQYGPGYTATPCGGSGYSAGETEDYTLVVQCSNNTYYRDADGDGYGDIAETITACGPPEGYVGNSSDFNDESINTYPSAIEICDGIDNNGNGQIDEDASYEATTFRFENETIFPDFYTASQSIECKETVTVAGRTKVELVAGTSVTLKAGFATQPGATFIARIAADCGNNTLQNPVASVARNQYKTPDNLSATSNNLEQKDVDLKVFPNPFQDQLSIQFEFNQASKASIFLMDVTGKRVRTLATTQNYNRGLQEVRFMNNGLSDGLYFIVLQTESQVFQRKVVMSSLRK